MTLAGMSCIIFSSSRCCCSPFYVRDGMLLTNALLSPTTLYVGTCSRCLKSSVAAAMLMSLFFNDDSLCLEDML